MGHYGGIKMEFRAPCNQGREGLFVWKGELELDSEDSG